MTKKLILITLVCLLLGAFGAFDAKTQQSKQGEYKSITNTLSQEPAANIKGKKIVQIGIVVKDIEKSAKRLSEIFGVPSWEFIDLTADKFENVVMHDKFLGNTAKTHLRVASGIVMGYQFELLQPVSGQSTHMEFLKKHGEGIHHIAIAPISDDEFTKMVAGFKNAGIEVEMQGLLGGIFTFTYMNTVDDLGLFFEFFKKDPTTKNTIPRYGGYKFDGAGVLDGRNMIIANVGIVIHDVRKAAKKFEELLGIGPWKFHEVQISNGIIRKQPIGHNNVSVMIATATHEGLQFELIQPVNGPSIHREFLEKHGNGIHHLSLRRIKQDDTQTHDIDLKLLKEEGIGVEMQGIIFGGTSMFTYLSSQEQLSGIIFEMGKPINKGKQNEK